MNIWRIAGALALSLCGAVPGSAQFYLQSRDFRGDPVRGDEPGIMQPMPGATDAERRAGLVWTLRSAMNVAALQCKFAPTLTIDDNYTAFLRDHRAELKQSYELLTRYYARTNPAKKAGQNALDQNGTRTYSSFSTVSTQFGFCQTAASILHEAIFTPPGHLASVAETRSRELRNSLAAAYGEQAFANYLPRETTPTQVPRLDQACWSRRGEWEERRCGPQNWPPARQ